MGQSPAPNATRHEATLSRRQVSNLWSLRDFWEWLAPGYNTAKADAFSTAAFTSYVGLRHFRDFKMERLPSQDLDFKVGLWAKVAYGTRSRYRRVSRSDSVQLGGGGAPSVSPGPVDSTHSGQIGPQAYMTTQDFSLLGTLLSTRSFQSVVAGREPPKQQRGVSEQKTRREASLANTTLL